MCRLLYVRTDEPFMIEEHLRIFADISKNSKEYQGHGWGCAYLEKGEWKIYTNIKPIWEDDITNFGSTTLLIAHARSAFRDEGIVVENNMPFFDGNYAFIFNGELRGVRIKEKGRIGAEKVFNFIKRFDNGNMQEAVKRGIKAIRNMTKYVRALNCIIADKNSAYLVSVFNEGPEYFQMYYRRSPLIICSEKYPDQEGWEAVENNTVAVL